MAKRRFNAKKIANTPSLKRNMAKFCAEIDVKFNKPDYVDLLYKGNRGYISMAEDDLCKEFDKRFEILKVQYEPLRKVNEEAQNRRGYRQSDSYIELYFLFEQATEIANEIFEETFLT